MSQERAKNFAVTAWFCCWLLACSARLAEEGWIAMVKTMAVGWGMTAVIGFAVAVVLYSERPKS